MPSRKHTQQLGTATSDVALLEKRYDNERKEAEIEAEKLREDWESGGKTDRYEKMQPNKRPEIDESFVGARIEQLWIYKEKTGKEKEIRETRVWCQGEVVAVRKGNKVHVKWDKKYLREGDSEVTEEKFLVSKWNKHTEESWRMDPEYLV